MLRLIKSLFGRLCCRVRSSSTRLSAGGNDDVGGSEWDFSYSERRYGFEQGRTDAHWNEKFDEGMIVAYTDASYNNGSGSMVAFFGHQNPLNRKVHYSERDELPGCKIKLLDFPKHAAPTYLEIQAVWLALDRLIEWQFEPSLYHPVIYKAPKGVIIRTDCLVLVQALRNKQDYVEKKIKDGVAINERVTAVRNKMAELGVKVTIQHVKGHFGDPGNSWADYYAKLAWGKPANQNVRDEDKPGLEGCSPRKRLYKGEKYYRPSPTRSPQKTPQKSPAKSFSSDLLEEMNAIEKPQTPTKKSPATSSTTNSTTPNKEQKKASEKQKEAEEGRQKKRGAEEAREKKETIESWKWKGEMYKPDVELKPGEMAWTKDLASNEKTRDGLFRFYQPEN